MSKNLTAKIVLKMPKNSSTKKVLRMPKKLKENVKNFND